jgi:hypothetical protein
MFKKRKLAKYSTLLKHAHVFPGIVCVNNSRYKTLFQIFVKRFAFYQRQFFLPALCLDHNGQIQYTSENFYGYYVVSNGLYLRPVV